MRKNLYNFIWVMAPVLFFIVFALTSRTCIMYSCVGNTDLAMTYGFTAVIVYLVIAKLLHMKRMRSRGQNVSWRKDFWGPNHGFLFILVVLVILAVYYLGKMNGIGQ